MFQDIHDGGDDHNDVIIILDIKMVWVMPWMNGCWAGAGQILLYLLY